MATIQSGKWCMFRTLAQDGPLCRKVCSVTTQLIKLADKCFEEESMAVLRKSLPSGMMTGTRLGAIVGTELHKVLYDMAVRSRENGTLEPRPKIARPTNIAIDPNLHAKG